jgi:hypothetical protein
MFAIAGVKTLIHLGAFIAALKRCATQNPGFSASCEAVPFPKARMPHNAQRTRPNKPALSSNDCSATGS